MSHPIKPTRTEKKMATTKRDAPGAPQWPSFTGTAQFVGTSPSGRVTVYVDPTLGQPGLQNAQDLVNDADRVANANDSIFGTTGGPVSVIVFALGNATDGTGGADHMGCDYQTGAAIEVDASFGNSARVSALFEAELSECSMNGNLCGESTGEALSRWCAAVVSNNALSDFATAPTWAQDGMPNWVDQTEPTDQQVDSTGCGMAFLSWLMSQGYGLNKIAPQMVSLGDSGTLAQLYASLTSDAATNAWSNFQAAVQNLPNGVTSDDPFGGAAQSAHLADISAGAVPALRNARASGTVVVCEPKAHRLQRVGGLQTSAYFAMDLEGNPGTDAPGFDDEEADGEASPTADLEGEPETPAPGWPAPPRPKPSRSKKKGSS
jgi:hypothetical protein